VEQGTCCAEGVVVTCHWSFVASCGSREPLTNDK
jgi:hypothetical protein